MICAAAVAAARIFDSWPLASALPSGNSPALLSSLSADVTSANRLARLALPAASGAVPLIALIRATKTLSAVLTFSRRSVILLSSAADIFPCAANLRLRSIISLMPLATSSEALAAVLNCLFGSTLALPLLLLPLLHLNDSDENNSTSARPVMMGFDFTCNLIWDSFFGPVLSK